jgi:hypothetical protein
MMKSSNVVIGTAEAFLIGIMGFCGVFFLTENSFYVLVRNPIAAANPAVGHYLPLIIWAIVFLFGFQSVILRKKGGGGLLWFVLVISFPALWSFISLNYLKIFGVSLKYAPEMNLYLAIGLGILIMTCYSLLNSMSVLKQFRRSLIKRKANPDDIENVHMKSNVFLLIAGGASLVTAAVITLMSAGIGTLFSMIIPKVPMYSILVGLGCILILAVYLYWVGSRKYQEE